MYDPTSSRLIETYKGQPFALLGVSTDASVGLARKTAKQHKISWPCWFDGKNGPIAQSWNVLKWPTTYVLDQHGKIAAKDVRGEELDRVVAKLVAGSQ